MLTLYSFLKKYRITLGFIVLLLSVSFALIEQKNESTDATQRFRSDEYKLCIAVNQSNTTLAQVVQTAFNQSSNNINPKTLTPQAQQVLDFLKPLLEINSSRSNTTEKAIEKKIPDQLNC